MDLDFTNLDRTTLGRLIGGHIYMASLKTGHSYSSRASDINPWSFLITHDTLSTSAPHVYIKGHYHLTWSLSNPLHTIRVHQIQRDILSNDLLAMPPTNVQTVSYTNQLASGLLVVTVGEYNYFSMPSVQPTVPQIISITSMTYNGLPLTKLASTSDLIDLVDNRSWGRGEIWYLVNPPVGTYNLVTTVTADPLHYVLIQGISMYTGVNLASPFNVLDNFIEPAYNMPISRSVATPTANVPLLTLGAYFTAISNSPHVLDKAGNHLLFSDNQTIANLALTTFSNLIVSSSPLTTVQAVNFDENLVSLPDSPYCLLIVGLNQAP